ncbi:hypothetical protein BCEN4_740100 [Burkholderia cenocepacia]|nr:hypothetical protein BCEN4_740100 [Burkholderia cenocepacia]
MHWNSGLYISDSILCTQHFKFVR